MTPSAVPRNVASVFPSRAAASTQTKRPVRFSGGTCLQFPQHTRIIRLIIGIRLGQMRLIRRIPRRMHARRATERVHLKPGVIGDHNLSRHIPAVVFRFLARVVFKRLSVFDNRRQGSEARDAADLNPMRPRRARKVAQLSRIRSSNQNSSHIVKRLSRNSSWGTRHREGPGFSRADESLK